MDLYKNEALNILDILDDLRKTWIGNIDYRIALANKAIWARSKPQESCERKPEGDAVDVIKGLQADLASEVQIAKDLTALQQYIRGLRQPGDEGPQNDPE